MSITIEDELRPEPASTLASTLGQVAPLYGVYPAIVTDNVDADNMGRVQVRLPWLSSYEGEVVTWARIATLMAGNQRGTYFMPEVDDEVLVAFEAGNAQRPYVVGALWNGKDEPPITDNSDNNQKQICSRNGITITLNDEDGSEQLTCETPAGQTLTLKDGPGTIEIKDASGNRITVEPSGITIQSSTNIKVNGTMVDINASMLRVTAGMSRFNGVVQCDTLISNSVVSQSYTPGAGNIW